MDEVWRLLDILDGAYSVSSLGRLRREKPGKRTRVGLILQECYDQNGYVQNRLFYGGQAKTLRRHQAVARLFIGSCPPGHKVNHKDGDKANNRVENLEYISRYQLLAFGDRNALRVPRNGIRRGERHGLAKLTEEKVREILRHPEISWAEFGRRFGVSKYAIRHVRIGKTWKHVQLEIS